MKDYQNMCGITGFLDSKNQNTKEKNLRILLEMTHELTQRGPDAFGVWSDKEEQVFFGHRRLSIIDLSEHGAQPMVSSSTRYAITYNGEVFNAPELREDLKKCGMHFKGYSDTEVVLAACEVWGIHNACNKFNGMFAFALWDSLEKKLFLVRDRIGVKPLYWGIQHGILFFGSQLKSFLKHPEFRPKVSLDAVSLYLKFNYITAPHTIYQDFHKVNPGCMVIIDHQLNTKELPFWQFSDFVAPEISLSSMNEEESTETLEVLLKDSVHKRMISDVPIGAFLSGGVDSSLIVSLMQSLSGKPVKTFSIGFKEESYNEAKYAKAVANHLGTDHHELYLNSTQALDIIPNLSSFYDEPFADISQIPTYLVSRQAREQVTVCLSGDGGDELFCGYDRYLIAQKLYIFHRLLPRFIKSSLAKTISHLTPHQWQKIFSYLTKKFQFAQISEKAYKLSDTLNSPTLIDFFQSFVTIWNNPAEILKPEGQWASDIYSPQILSTLTAPMTLMPYFDMKTFLPECVLTKVDRASMAVGLEVRTPFLDYRMAEFSCNFPTQYKIKDGKTKAPLRKILSKYVPDSLIDRPKMGFSVPLGEWLRSDLKEWSENYLSEKALAQAGFFNPKIIRQKWQDHLSGKINSQYQLWSILMFQQWAEKNHVRL
jgi:asparagine synthase (glutamine-hydrolysing)